MARVKMRATSEICADCSAPDPTWAVINRGVLVCADCCSVHRSLGRHISQVKSLTHGQWVPQQLIMVKKLAAMGANSIWEHSLLEPVGHSRDKKSKKPSKNDPIHPNKADFIRSKYKNLSFLNKQRDMEITSLDDLSQQLHSSARTPNLETSLRLLSLGADPNYFYEEKGNTALHVAAQCCQALQVELLLMYGADPGSFDQNGQTPDQLARKEKAFDLADRLVESQYELTDKLTYYLCNRKPDHKSSQHFVIPAMADTNTDMSELAKTAKSKLQALPNHHFEELAKDVYDEVDRRENEEVWKTLVPSHQPGLVTVEGVPFLPVNPDYSHTRNQGRQKLARFNNREFTTLLIDILTDVKRRQGLSLPPVNNLGSHNTSSMVSDDEPLYDHVASDEDYSSIGDNQSLKDVSLDPGRSNTGPSENGTLVHDTNATGSQSAGTSQQEEVLRALAESRQMIAKLEQSNRLLQEQVSSWQVAYQTLEKETQWLRQHTATPPTSSQPHHSPNSVPTVTSSRMRVAMGTSGVTSGGGSSSTLLQEFKIGRGGGGGGSGGGGGAQSTRPASMFEPREHSQRNNPTWTKAPAIAETSLEQSHSASHVTAQSFVRDRQSRGSGRSSSTGGGSSQSLRLEHQTDSLDSDYDNSRGSERSSSTGGGSSQSLRLEHQTDSLDSDYDNAAVPEDGNPAVDPTSEDAEAQLEQAADSARRSGSTATPTESMQTLLEMSVVLVRVYPHRNKFARGSGSTATPTESMQTLLEDVSSSSESLPTQEQVVKKTENITKKIQDLLKNAQDGKHEGYSATADRIYSAVNDMVKLFPTMVEKEKIENALNNLTMAAERLREQCSTSKTEALTSPVDIQQHTQSVIKCAYDIAQAAKSLVCSIE